jgi:HK97 family phage major capsid protein
VSDPFDLFAQKVAQLDPDAHPGAMVALMLSPAQQAAITADIPGRLAQEADHCTLAVLAGDAAALTANKVALVAALAALAQRTAPISAAINGYGAFAGDESEYPLVLLLDSPALPSLHHEIAEAAAAAGITPDESHGFTPHITLAYLPADKPMPRLGRQAASIRFDAISLVWAGERIDLPLMPPDEVADQSQFAGETMEDFDDGEHVPSSPEVVEAARRQFAAALGLDPDSEAGRGIARKALGTDSAAAGGALVPTTTPKKKAEGDEDEEAEADDEAELVRSKPSTKSLTPPDPSNPYVIKKYLVVWDGQDLTGDSFTRETDLGLSRSLKGMPFYYDHTLGRVKSQVGQVVDDGEDDGTGIVVSIELDRAKRYAAKLLQLERQGALGTSSGAPKHLVVRQGGTLKRWIIAEGSFSPEPAEPRTRAAIKSTLEETPMGDEPTTTTTATTATTAGADIAALEASVKAIAADLESLKSMPAVAKSGWVQPGHAPNESEVEAIARGGGWGGGLGLAGVASPQDAYDRFRNFKSISYFGGPTKPEEYPQHSIGGMVRAVYRASTRDMRAASDAVKALRDVYGSDPESPAAKALSTETGVSGGYTIGQQFLPTLMQVTGMAGDGLYERAMIIPSEGGELVVPALHQSGAYVAGQSQFFGGVTVTWGSDDAGTTETEPKFDQIKLKTNAMKALVKIPNSLMQRSAVSIDAVITTLLGNAIGWSRNYALFQGTGSGQPLGIINSPAGIDYGGSAIDFATISGMLNRIVPSRADNYVWYCHALRRSNINALQQTNNTLVTFLPDLRGKPGTQLLGLPVIYTDKLPYDSSDVSNSLVLTDPSSVLVSEYQGVQIAVSDQAYFGADQTGIRVILSLDAQPWLKAPVAIGSGVNDTVSTIVKI